MRIISSHNIMNWILIIVASANAFPALATMKSSKSSVRNPFSIIQRRCTTLLSSTAQVASETIQQHEQRPAFVLEILNDNNATDNKNNDVEQPFLYYFGVGSNMLRSKIENRGINGTSIEILEMEPAVVKGHRLAFNMRGFPPLEPAMGSLEPVGSESKPLLPYDFDECHGALVKVTPENYEKIMRSEGVGFNTTTSNGPFGPGRRRQDVGYEEVVVTAIPYNSSKVPVQAVALRAKSRSRLLVDGCPSQRYMSILQQGATELGLVASYQQYLQNHPIQSCPNWLRQLSVKNFLFLMTMSNILKTRILSQIQSWFLYRVYARVPASRGNETTIQKLRQSISHLLMGIILFPGGVVGSVIRYSMQLLKKPLPGMLQMLEENSQSQNSTTVPSNATTNTKIESPKVPTTA